MDSPAFQFYPKQWLGDDKVLAMDWDARAMHMHLMCIAWQQTPPCTLPDDDAIIRRWLGNPKKWVYLKNQIFSAWKMNNGRWLQSGLLEQYNKQSNYRESRKAGSDARWGKDAHAMHMDLKNPVNHMKTVIEDSSLGSSLYISPGVIAKKRGETVQETLRNIAVTGPSEPDSVSGIPPHSIAQEIMKRAKITSDPVFLAVASQVKLEIGDGDADEELANHIAERMVSAWTSFRDLVAAGKMEFQWTAQKFFNEGYWRDESGWPWRKEHRNGGNHGLTQADLDRANADAARRREHYAKTGKSL
jgi:hypothetical protein